MQTLFRGETLRGLLLYAWGWAVVGEIAYWTAIAALVGALFVLLALALGYYAHDRALKQATAEAGAVDIAQADEPLPVH